MSAINLSKQTCPECELDVDPDDRDALLVGDQWWHNYCDRAASEYDEYLQSQIDDLVET